jgi:hypothetical protein
MFLRKEMDVRVYGVGVRSILVVKNRESNKT